MAVLIARGVHASAIRFSIHSADSSHQKLVLSLDEGIDRYLVLVAPCTDTACEQVARASLVLSWPS